MFSKNPMLFSFEIWLNLQEQNDDRGRSYDAEMQLGIARDAKKTCFFSNHVFYAKRKVFFIEKNSFLMFFLFFSITGRFLINYSAIRVYL